MKTLIAFSILLSTFAAQAASVQFVCRDRSGHVSIKGSVHSEALRAQIFDFKNSLEIRELSVGEKVEFQRINRKKEASYKFAKYYSDFNAWQGIELSIPKNIGALHLESKFAAYLTIYLDNGDQMQPGEVQNLSCLMKP